MPRKMLPEERRIRFGISMTPAELKKLDEKRGPNSSIKIHTSLRRKDSARNEI